MALKILIYKSLTFLSLPEDVLQLNSGECAICLDELRKGRVKNSCEQITETWSVCTLFTYHANILKHAHDMHVT